jgi:hypothetical protein
MNRQKVNLSSSLSSLPSSVATDLFVYFITEMLSDITILPAGLKPKPTTNDSAEVPRELSGLTT